MVERPRPACVIGGQGAFGAGSRGVPSLVGSVSSGCGSPTGRSIKTEVVKTLVQHRFSRIRGSVSRAGFPRALTDVDLIISPVADRLNGAHKGCPSQEPAGFWVGAGVAGELLGSRTIECGGDCRTTAEDAGMFSEALDADRQLVASTRRDLFNLGDLMAPLNEIGVRVGNPDR